MSCCGNDGFTLIEIIIVCVLIGLFLFIAVPAVQTTIADSSLNASARKLAAAVGVVRQTAISEHSSYLLTFDLAAQRYWYEKDGTVHPFGEEAETVVTLDKDARIEKIHTTEDGMQSSGDVELWISPKGYMDQTEIYLTDESNEEQRILYFSAFGGLRRITDGSGGTQ